MNKLQWQILKISAIVGVFGLTGNKAIAQDLQEQELLEFPMSQITNVGNVSDELK